MSKKNYNINSMSGMDDMEVCNDLGLDPSVAYTPDINDAAIDLIHKRNIEAEQELHMKHGVDYFEAEKKATQMADASKRDTEKLLKKVQKKRGYK